MNDIDFDNIEARRVEPTSTLRDQIVERWVLTIERLVELRDGKKRIAEDIKELVAELADQRRLVRVVAPELLKEDPNGE